jgi:hypothetical protein
MLMTVYEHYTRNKELLDGFKRDIGSDKNVAKIINEIPQLN